MRRGSIAIVTGGSRGLGLLLAEGLTRRGATAVLVARDREELDRARARLQRRGARVATLAEDLEDPGAADRVVEKTLARFGRVDVLVNDAGVISVGPHGEMSLEDYRHAMETNFWAALRMTRAALPALEASRGSILNVTSIGGAVPVPHLLPYTASKFAAVGWSTGLAAELGRRGVRVVTVLPWLIRTGSFLHAELEGQRGKEAVFFALASSLPGVTLSARRAARRILRGLDRGERFVTVGLFAKLARLGFAIFPSLSIAALALVNRALPRPPAGESRAGAEPLWMHRSGLAASLLTRLGDRAAARNNETVHVPAVPGITGTVHRGGLPCAH